MRESFEKARRASVTGKRFRDRLGHERLYWDGGTGSLLQERGLAGGELPERWNLTHPGDMVAIARSYYEAGSDIVNANTFGANRLHYPDPEELRNVVEQGVRHVCEARRMSGRDDAFVALDIGPTGRLLKPMGDLDFEEAVAVFGEVVRTGAAAGADLVLIETMSDSLEAKAAVLAAKENSDLPVCVTVIFDGSGKLLTGGSVESVTAMLEGLGVDALGVNCGLGPAEMRPLAEKLMARASVPVIVNPNAGLPRAENGRTVYDLTPVEFASEMEKIAALGVHVLGGCCGTTPAYIRAMIGKTSDIPFVPPVKKHFTVVSSFSRAVEIGERPVIIGERINPTGKKRLKEALLQGDLDYILEQGLSQEESGADLLDVNVGLPGIDEGAMMEKAVTALQGALALPLQIDTSDPEALERGLRIYNGKPMVNSVTGKEESMEAVFPLVKKYGGVLVALPLDESGIPGSADGRIRIARRILKRAEEYGIPREDIVADGLAMTVSADTSSAATTLETIRRIREELGCHTILGVSNVSFGLPSREVINSFFFAMALEAGLSCGIINPGNAGMMAAFRSYMALSGQDPHCGEYIGYFGDGQTGFLTRAAAAVSAPGGAERKTRPEEQSLGTLVRKGLSEKAVSETGRLLAEGCPPMEIINDCLIPALDEVGRGFGEGRIFLPQLLMSSEAAKAAFEVIRDRMGGSRGEPKGRVILATVKGDIHDIGKNIVKVLLENYGYEVLDLGKDVPPEVIADAACGENSKLVGLSALMTTTVVSMEETIRLLRTRKPDVRIAVGGAVMTKEYADSIGADFYAKEAMDTVRYADEVFLTKEGLL